MIILMRKPKGRQLSTLGRQLPKSPNSTPKTKNLRNLCLSVLWGYPWLFLNLLVISMQNSHRSAFKSADFAVRALPVAMVANKEQANKLKGVEADVLLVYAAGRTKS